MADDIPPFPLSFLGGVVVTFEIMRTHSTGAGFRTRVRSLPPPFTITQDMTESQLELFNGPDPSLALVGNETTAKHRAEATQP